MAEKTVKYEESSMSLIKQDSFSQNKSSNDVAPLTTVRAFIATKDNSRNIVYFQDVPTVCKSQPCLLGIDEAGRGPVLGPMVYGIAYCPLDSKQVLIDLDCADSKQLTEGKREVIFNEINAIKSRIGWAVELISPNVISNNMYRRAKCSLNEISMNSAIDLVKRALYEGVNVAEIYVDTVGPPEKYQSNLEKIFPNIKITVAKKADSTYPIVSAASICAKVTRDHALNIWNFHEGLQLKFHKFGSGYPNDPITKRFLSENIDLVFGFPRLVRFSWSTAENALTDNAYDMEFDVLNVEKCKFDVPKLTKYFEGVNKNGEKKHKPYTYLNQRYLKNIYNF